MLGSPGVEMPSGTEAYYSFDYGRIHFICLDSHDTDRSPTGAMAQWLKADLESTARDVTACVPRGGATSAAGRAGWLLVAGCLWR